LMSLVAVTTVAAFEAVGSIIVIAMLIVPAATALLLTDRLWVMVTLSVVFACASALFGHISALIVPSWFGFDDTSTSGMIAVVSGLFFALTMFVAPRHGLLRKWL
ncbi:MAG: metal ABC transporter permease, partial [Verrucomicrobiota bacterium]|nr:metal ABC transporter permease [Verrucomicrobiota bacterium]